jgi:hypothetical protein
MLPFDASLWRSEQALHNVTVITPLSPYPWIAATVGIVSVLVIAWAVYRSKRENREMMEIEKELEGE